MKSKIITVIYYSLSLILIDMSLYFLSVSVIPSRFTQLFSLISIAISSTFVGILLYDYTKKFGSPRDKTYGTQEKNLYSKFFPEINFELSQEYSKEYKPLIGKDISIYTFNHSDNIPFAFLIENNDKPDIYIEDNLLNEVSGRELDMLVLHELGHYKYHHERKKNTGAKMFIFSLLLNILAYTLYLNTNSFIFFFAFAIFFPSLSIVILLYIIILISREQVSADKFALKYMGDDENYLKFLLKLKSFTNSAEYYEKRRKYAIKDINKRIKKIEGMK
jgi:Zn-dependent protease with chaperone function